MTDSNNSKVVMCYSYKGGTGRTSAAVNIATYLSLKDNNVALIDLDYEAPGVPVFFYKKKSIENLVSGESMDVFPDSWIQDYLRNPIPKGSDYQVPPPIRLEEYLNSGVIDISDKLNEEYQDAPQKIPQSSSFLLLLAHPDIKKSLMFTGAGIVDRLKNLFTSLRNDYNIDYFILDSPSGVRQSTLPPLMVSDLLLVFFRFSVQHYTGTINTIQYIQRLRESDKIDSKLWLIPSNVPQEELLSEKEVEDLERLKNVAYGKLSEVSGTTREEIKKSIVREEFTLRWQEMLVPFKGKTVYDINDPGYEKLTEGLIEWGEA